EHYPVRAGVVAGIRGSGSGRGGHRRNFSGGARLAERAVVHALPPAPPLAAAVVRPLGRRCRPAAGRARRGAGGGPAPLLPRGGRCPAPRAAPGRGWGGPPATISARLGMPGDSATIIARLGMPGDPAVVVGEYRRLGCAGSRNGDLVAERRVAGQPGYGGRGG